MAFLGAVKKYHEKTGITKAVKKVSPAANIASSREKRKKVVGAATGGSAAESLMS